MSLGGYGCQKFILRAHTLALRTTKENTGKERFLSIFQPTIKYTHTHTHTHTQRQMHIRGGGGGGGG